MSGGCRRYFSWHCNWLRSVASRFPNPNGIEIIQPKVARNELPWVDGKEILNPERVAYQCRADATLTGLGIVKILTLGSSFLATQG
jgi:hypothetical protein